MAYDLEVKFFNSFWLKKVNAFDITLQDEAWPGLPWNPTGYYAFPFGSNAVTVGTLPATNANMWYIEEARVKGGFDNVGVDIGVKAFVEEDNPIQKHLTHSLIYSGVLNSRTGVNETNVFSISDAITRSANPAHGAIQKLFAANNNLTLFQERKVSKALIDKDTIYTAEGGTQTNAANIVIGQIIPYAGEYGISRNPESFAEYGYRKYFTDKDRGLVLRLSRDGITEISSYGMRDYFRDHLATVSEDWLETIIGEATYAATVTLTGDTAAFSMDITTSSCCTISIGSAFEVLDSGAMLPVFDNSTGERIYVTNVTDNGDGTCNVDLSGQSTTLNWSWTASGGAHTVRFIKFVKGQVLGGWDIHNNHYVCSIQTGPPGYTPAYSYSTVSFDEPINGWTSFHTYHPKFIGSLRDRYYSFRDGEVWQHYDEVTSNNRTSYYGVPTTHADSKSNMTFIFNPSSNIVKNFQTISYEGSNGWGVDSYVSDIEQANRSGVSWIENQDTTSSIFSYAEGRYETAPPYNSGALAVTPPYSYAGFNRKENRYVANLVSSSVARSGEVIFGNAMSGIKGYYATVKVSTDSLTQVGGMKELFAVSSNFVVSSK